MSAARPITPINLPNYPCWLHQSRDALGWLKSSDHLSYRDLIWCGFTHWHPNQPEAPEPIGCVCGEPSTAETVHRQDGPCYQGTPPAPAGAEETHRIVCAAMLMDDGLIVTGVRHYSPDMRLTLHRLYGDGYHLRVREQGFIDTHGQFLDRERAWWRAVATKQIREQVSVPGTLYSENLY